MLGIFGKLSASQAMPSWEQVPTRRDRARQAAALTVQAVTLAAAAVGLLLSAILALLIVVAGPRRRRRPAPGPRAPAGAGSRRAPGPGRSELTADEHSTSTADPPAGRAAWQPPTAFVLAGGAPLGAMQAGMIHALYERGITPDLLIGASAGALNAAFLASRPATAATAEELAARWRGLRRSDILPLRPATLLSGLGRRDHLIPGRALRRLAARHLQFERLEQAAIPLQPGRLRPASRDRSAPVRRPAGRRRARRRGHPRRAAARPLARPAPRRRRDRQ